MDFEHTEERKLLAEMVRRYIADNYDLNGRHTAAALPEGFSRERWQAFAELGLIGALFPESAGGYGGAGADIAVLFEELGRGLVVEPFLAALLAGTVLAETRSDCPQLAGLIAEETILALAHEEADSRYDLARVTTEAKHNPDGSGWVISGAKSVVLAGDSADWLIVSARISGEVTQEAGIGLFLIPANADGLSIRGYPTVDGMHAAEIALEAVTVDADALLAGEGSGYAMLERAIGAGLLALSAEALGAMDVSADLTVEYFKTRSQFGKTIGSFQALQHRLADVLIEISQTRSSLINAASRFGSDDRQEREWALSAVKVCAGRNGQMVAEEVIQMHGGIGMTWDYAVGHYAKRLVMIDHMLGDADHHLLRVANLSKGGE